MKYFSTAYASLIFPYQFFHSHSLPSFRPFLHSSKAQATAPVITFNENSLKQKPNLILFICISSLRSKHSRVIDPTVEAEKKKN